MITISSSKSIGVLLLAGAGLVGLNSCSKSNSSSASSARVMYTNGCVGATATSLTVNGSTLADASGVVYLGNSGYHGVASGSASLTSTLTGVGTLGSLSTTLNANASYSVFDCGTVLADTLVIVADALPSTSGSYAYARLVNVSSDTTATAITGAVGNTVVGSAVAYGAASGFVQVTPGSYSLTALNVNKPGNVATLSNVQLNGGKIYTLLYSGNSNASVGFKITVINNN
ncbi:MAG TPA: DUF4397 domain-containing protein [Puia sp.]|nr:DUF4397 domain-containing protein [Puia sp.]